MKKPLLLVGVLLFAAVAGAALYMVNSDSTSSGAPKPIAPIDASPDVALAPYLKGEMQELVPFAEREALYDYPIYIDGGQIIPLNRLKGKAMLINLWASWCAPCRAEMKELANLQRELGNENFEVVAINVDFGGLEQARETLDEWGIEGLALYADPTLKTSQELALGRLPTSLVVSRDGTVIAKYLGALKWDEPEAITLFRALRAGEI